MRLLYFPSSKSAFLFIYMSTQLHPCLLAIRVPNRVAHRQYCMHHGARWFLWASKFISLRAVIFGALSESVCINLEYWWHRVRAHKRAALARWWKNHCAWYVSTMGVGAPVPPSRRRPPISIKRIIVCKYLYSALNLRSDAWYIFY